MEELDNFLDLMEEYDAIAPNRRAASSTARQAVLRGLGPGPSPGLGPTPSSADPVVACAISRRAAELVPAVGWRVAGTCEVLSCPALVGQPVMFHWPDEGRLLGAR